MGRYRARDLLKVPCLVSLARVPMAAAFPFVVHDPRLAVGLLLVAGASDVFDGWYARTFGQVTPMGAVVDPITDKVFVLTVACTLLARGALSPLSLLMLSTREIGELPLLLLLLASRSMRRRRTEEHSANLAGKATTLLQFVAIVAALFHSVHTPRLVLATAVVGVFSAAIYWLRALRRTKDS
jgi:cardiolipin synthase